MPMPPTPTQRCAKCGTVKPLGDFHRRGQGDQLPRTVCKVCQYAEVQAARATGDRNGGPERYRREARRRLNMEAVWRYLSTHPCVDCGEADPVVLEFDHVHGTKVGPIASLINGRAWATIAAEIDKCVVRCANCHRRKTAAAAGWYGYLGQDHDAIASELLRQHQDHRTGQLALPIHTEETTP